MSRHDFADREKLAPYLGQRYTIYGVVIRNRTNHRKHQHHYQVLLGSIYIPKLNLTLDHLILNVSVAEHRQLLKHRWHWVALSGIISRYRMPVTTDDNDQTLYKLTTYGFKKPFKINPRTPSVDTHAPLSTFVEHQVTIKDLPRAALAQLPNTGEREFWVEHLPERSSLELMSLILNNRQSVTTSIFGKAIPGISATYTVNRSGILFNNRTAVEPILTNGQRYYQLIDPQNHPIRLSQAELVARAYLHFKPGNSRITFNDHNQMNAHVDNLTVIEQTTANKDASPERILLQSITNQITGDDARRPIPSFPVGWEISRSGKIFFKNQQLPKTVKMHKGNGNAKPYLIVDRFQTIKTLEYLTPFNLSVYAFHPSQITDQTTITRHNRPDVIDPQKYHDFKTTDHGSNLKSRVQAIGNLLQKVPYLTLNNQIKYGRSHNRYKLILFNDGLLILTNQAGTIIVTSDYLKLLKYVSMPQRILIQKYHHQSKLYDQLRVNQSELTATVPNSTNSSNSINPPTESPSSVNKPISTASSNSATPPANSGLTVTKDGFTIRGLTFDQVKALLSLNNQ